MGIYDDLLIRLGLTHLKNDPEKLREEILKELGLYDLKDDQEALNEKYREMIEDNRKKLEASREDLGKLIQKRVMKNDN